MSTHAGTLLWRRAHITIPAEPGFITFDTGIRQVNLALGEDPSFAERLMVIPLPPMSGWDSVTISEPVVGVNGTMEVTFSRIGLEVAQQLNVLFWDPHTIVGPGQTDPYNPIQ